jgi:hypothetical protein
MALEEDLIRLTSFPSGWQELLREVRIAEREAAVILNQLHALDQRILAADTAPVSPQPRPICVDEPLVV